MIGFLTVLFIILCFALAGLVLLQQGKGDLGMGGLGNGGQLLFGGSGGQEFFERLTWILGACFIFGALGLSILRSTQTGSRVKNFQAPVKISTTTQAPTQEAQAPAAN